MRYVGGTPRILALPKAFKLASVHLMMKNEYPGADSNGRPSA